ncbi:MAG: ExeA family protein [Nitrospirota bacterium]
MSYLDYYQLREHPFSITVDPKFYYNSQQHDDALVRLMYAASERKGLAVLVGEVGAGKTTVARRLLDQLDETEFEAALLIIVHAAITSQWLLKKIATQLGVEQPAEDSPGILSQLSRRLVELFEQGKKVVVLIDEAQMLHSREIMEEFRGILNMESDGQKLITFVLFGLPELDQTLALDGPLAQRVAIRYQLRAFTDAITRDYITFRLKVAGSERNPFTPGAIATIHRVTGGTPRLINTLCDNALLEGYLRKLKAIDESLIHEVAGSLKLDEPLASAA